MEIEKIKKLNNGKYKINFSDGTSIITYDDVILKNNVLYNKNINETVLNEMNKDNNFYKIYNKVIKYISKRVRSQKEIEEYISTMEILDEERDSIILMLKEKGFIDDDNFTKAYIADKMNLSKIGPNKIIAELLEHNIDYNKIIYYLDKIDKDYIYEKLNRLINKRIQSIKKGSIYIIKQKIKNEYIQLGYDETCIIDILDKQIIENNIEKEYFSILKKLEKKYTGNELEYQVKQRLYQKGYKTIEIEKITKKSRI